RDKEYDITQGKPGSKITWFTANPNGEAEVLRITLKPKFRLKILQFDVNLAELAIKGKQARGNIVTKNEVHRITLKEAGQSTLGDREVWFDQDILRINYEGHGTSLGLFGGDDRIVVIMRTGEFYTTSTEASNHYDEGILRIEKYIKDKVWTAVLDDADQGHPYVKRFTLEDNNKKQSFIGTNPESRLLLLSDEPCPRFEVKMGGGDAFREPFVIDAEEFIGVKTFKAKGRRVTNWAVDTITEIDPREPAPVEEQTTTVATTEDEGDTPTAPADGISQDEVLDSFTGQQRIPFDD
ncbi:MAG: DNA gyrase/topoisomerase IV subunit A, partial [Muribaculaceae bacterium]|nr:DNA gyrase/topoisomerase IV subunit A [Muribaculaceae bacterium]